MMKFLDDTYSYIFVPTITEATTLRKVIAHASDGGLISTHVMTFTSFIADMWELWGDGRKLINPIERKLVAYEICQSASDGLSASFGTSLLLARCAQALTGLEAFEGMLNRISDNDFCDRYNVDEACRLYIARIKQYRGRINELGRVEFGEAVRLLQTQPVLGEGTRVLFYMCGPMTSLQKQFFSAFENVMIDEKGFGPRDGIDRASDDIDVRFAFSAGKQAQPLLICDIIDDQKDLGSYVVVSPYPLKLYEQVAPRLHEQGHVCSVEATKSFIQIDIGRAFFAMYRLCTDNQPYADDVSDITFAPCVGFSRDEAWKIDECIKSDRLFDFRSLRMKLTQESDVCKLLEGVIDAGSCGETSHIDGLLKALEEIIRAQDRLSDVYIHEQIAALEVCRRVMVAALWAHASLDACVQVLEATRVSVVRGQIGGIPDVSFIDMHQVLSLEPASVGCVILTDMSTESYPVKDVEDICTSIMDVLKIDHEATGVMQARRLFSAAKDAASASLVIERPLHDAKAEPTYPCMAVEEFVDNYRVDPSATDDIDNDYALPEVLQQRMYERGEEALYCNASVTRIEQGFLEPETLCIDEARETLRELVAPLSKRGAVVYDKLVVSPSALESCIECPYKWFASRRLGLHGIHEEFGPREKGSYMHECLETFYKRYQESTGEKKVCSQYIDDAHEIMAATIKDVREAQGNDDHTDGRLIALTQMEERERGSLEQRLQEFVDYEALFLPDFKPTYFEYEIPPDAKVTYAGCYLSGKIDRIDVNDRGQAVIIDYKSSFNESYAIQNETGYYKVQTLVYATAIQKLLGLEVIGALYLNVLRKDVSGAYDSLIIETTALPDVKKAERLQVPGSFQQVLEVTEKRIAGIMKEISQGQIHRNPASADVCKYCPVCSCERRVN